MRSRTSRIPRKRNVRSRTIGRSTGKRSSKKINRSKRTSTKTKRNRSKKTRPTNKQKKNKPRKKRSTRTLNRKRGQRIQKSVPKHGVKANPAGIFQTTASEPILAESTLFTLAV